MSIRKNVVGFMALVLMVSGSAQGLWAALTDSVTVTVRIQTLSVDIGEASFDFGALAYNQSQVSSVFNVTNSGNVTEKYQLQASIGPDWSFGNTNGDLQAVLYAIFRTDGEGAPAESLFTVNTDTISVTNKTAETGVFSDGSGDNGSNVAQNNFRDLYLMIRTPTLESSNAGATQTIYLTITALAQ